MDGQVFTTGSRIADGGISEILIFRFPAEVANTVIAPDFGTLYREEGGLPSRGVHVAAAPDGPCFVAVDVFGDELQFRVYFI